MEIIIDIPEEIRLALINNVQLSQDQQSFYVSCMQQAIINGVSLPKEHGRLIDEDQIPGDNGWDFSDRLMSTPSIIDANTESEEDDGK